jgi:type III pantothenate kinase
MAPRIVADLGNSRLKWGRVDASGRVDHALSLPVDDEERWEAAWRGWGSDDGASRWAIASVNPPLAERLGRFLNRLGVEHVSWYRSAVEIPIAHGLAQPETAGVDRALAVLAARTRHAGQGPGIVVLCGTAVTVEFLDADGVWRGGAITSGLNMLARALHTLTAQLPLIVPRAEPRPVGNATLPALEAGVYWGVVGAVRELIARQSDGISPPPWVVWTGGDAETLAKAVPWPRSEVLPDLVLHGLAAVAFGEERSG